MGVEAWPWEVWVNGSEPRVPEMVTRTPGPKSLQQETGCQTRQTPLPGAAVRTKGCSGWRGAVSRREGPSGRGARTAPGSGL